MLPGKKSAEWDRHVAEELVSYGCPVVYFSGEKPEGVCTVDLKTERYGVEEILAAGAFITGFATRIGEVLGTTPEQLKHVVHHVEEL